MIDIKVTRGFSPGQTREFFRRLEPHLLRWAPILNASYLIGKCIEPVCYGNLILLIVNLFLKADIWIFIIFANIIISTICAIQCLTIIFIRRHIQKKADILTKLMHLETKRKFQIK